MKTTLAEDLLKAKLDVPWDVGLGRAYCMLFSFLTPKTAQAQGVSSTPRAIVAKQNATTASIRTPITKAQAPVLARRPPNPVPTTGQATPPPAVDAVALSQLEGLRLRLIDSSQLMNSYGVEIHKKFALAVACFVFVLLGAPIALRFPRGGVGLTIGVSLFVFALYYVCLIAGESIAKRGMMPAVISMWMANVIFALIALWLLSRMGKEGSTSRGGDMREMFGTVKGFIRSKLGWRDRRVQRERMAA